MMCIRVSLVENSKQQPSHASYGDDPDNNMQHLKQAIMHYHNEQLTLPKQINRIKEEMTISAKEQSIASDTQLKGHAHHYFVSPYKNTLAQGGQVRGGGVGAESLRISHPEPLITAGQASNSTTNLNDSKDESTSYVQSISKDPLPNKTRTKLASTNPDKLPPIFSIISPRRGKPQKGGLIGANSDNTWLGPPKSIPPNKRNEHIAAYKTISTRIKSSDRKSSRSTRSWTQIQQDQRAKEDEEEAFNDITPLPSGPGILKTPSASSHFHDDQTSNLSFSSHGDNTDTFSMMSDSTFRNLRMFEREMHYHSGRNSLVSRSRSRPDLEHGSTMNYSEANTLGNVSTNAVLPSNESSYLEDFSTFSSTSHRHKKSVHFAPDVRDISREDRTQPLTSASSKSTNSPVGLRMPQTYSAGSSEPEQLPAVLEKFTIKSLPVLPNISPNALNVNANIIYIKGEGAVTSASSTSTSASRRNVHHQARGIYSPNTYHNLSEHLARIAQEDDDEEVSVSMTQGIGISPRQIKVTLPSANSNDGQQRHYEKSTSTAATPTNHTMATPSPSQPSSNRVSQNKKSNTPPKKAGYSTKKGNVQKSKTSGSNTNKEGTSSNGKKSKKITTRTSSESSSRNSTNSSSPINDPDDTEQRFKDYAQAMLMVQTRMREFDIKFGAPQQIEMPNEDKDRFGKVVVSSAAQKDFNKNIPKGGKG